MIQIYTRLKVADNSGAKVISCIGIPGGTGRGVARLGGVFMATLEEERARDFPNDIAWLLPLWA